MAFNSKILTFGFTLFLVGISTGYAEELSLAEQKEKSLEERYRRLLAFSNMGDLQARKSHEEALRKAKQAWDRQRSALGKDVHEFKQKELEKPIVMNDLDQSSKDLMPVNSAHHLGNMHPIEFPSKWIETKISALNYLITIPEQKPHYILSSTPKISVAPPNDLKQWKLWQYFESQNKWSLLKSGNDPNPIELLPDKNKISSYAFFPPLKYPGKLDSEDITFTQVELDLEGPKLSQASWTQHHQHGIQLSWSFEDKNFNENEVIVLLEHKRQERSKVLIQQPRAGEILIEPLFARWTQSVSFISYDLAGHVSHHHFKIKH